MTLHACGMLTPAAAPATGADRVLLGGNDSDTAEIFDPAAGTFTFGSASSNGLLKSRKTDVRGSVSAPNFN